MIRRHFHDVYFDLRSLGDFGVHVSGEAVFKSPEKVYESVEVPGKHGDLLLDTGRFSNLAVKYPAFILGDSQRDFADKISTFRNYVLSREGYVRLEDTYYPDEYRLARYSGPMDFDAIMLQGGNFDLEFNAKPQKYLKVGNARTEYISNDTIHNPTFFDAFPMLRIYGSGTVGLGQCTIQITSHSFPYIDVDCDLMDAYYSATNCNNLVTFIVPDGKNNIYLHEGDNGLTLGTGITKVIVQPRWWIV